MRHDEPLSKKRLAQALCRIRESPRGRHRFATLEPNQILKRIFPCSHEFAKLIDRTNFKVSSQDFQKKTAIALTTAVGEIQNEENRLHQTGQVCENRDQFAANRLNHDHDGQRYGTDEQTILDGRGA
jgi:hypothetical protein